MNYYYECNIILLFVTVNFEFIKLMWRSGQFFYRFKDYIIFFFTYKQKFFNEIELIAFI